MFVKLGFLEGVISNVIRYHRNKKGEVEEIHVTRWDTVSEDSFMEVEDSVIEQSKVLKSYGDESTRGPSNSMFTNYLEKDHSKYIEVEIPQTDKSKFNEIENAKLNPEIVLELCIQCM